MTERPPGRPLAVITGASQGLGRTIATFVAGEGFDLIVTARGRAPLEAAAEGFRRAGASVETLPGDVSDPDHRAAVIDRVARRGELQLLVNNASELGPSPLPELAQAPLPAVRRVFEVNVLSPLALIQGLLPYLEKARGRVVNVSSDAAVGGYPGWGTYGASKAALDLVSKTLAEELKSRGTTVISVDPGDMRTAMHQAAFPGQDISDRPTPDATLPFWAWVLSQAPSAVNGQRFRAQADRWEPAA